MLTVLLTISTTLKKWLHSPKTKKINQKRNIKITKH